MIQENFRIILEAMSQPGTTRQLQEIKNNYSNLSGYTMAVIKTLVDPEVSYYVVGDDASTNQEIEVMTLSHQSTIEQADFVIIAKNETVDSVLNRVKTGDFIHPEIGATVIIEVNDFKGDIQVALTGPGIKETLYCNFDNGQWIEERRLLCEEFPKGIDMIFIDSTGQVRSIPRSTKVKVL